MEQIVDLIDKAVRNGTKINPAGVLHSMGGQQLIEKGVIINSNSFQKIDHLDLISKSMKLGSGVTWPQVTEWLSNTQKAAIKLLSIIQMQAGADNLYPEPTQPFYKQLVSTL